jgi:hypothetical protein
VKTFFKPFALAAGGFAMIILADVPGAMLGASLVREAGAVVVVRRAAPVATAAVVTTAVVASSSASASAAAQANATAQANANAAAQANKAAAEANKAAADAKAAAAAPPAVGSIVTSLPAGCTQTKLNNTDYMRCGATYYKPTMAGDAVVFVVAQP